MSMKWPPRPVVTGPSLLLCSAAPPGASRGVCTTWRGKRRKRKTRWGAGKAVSAPPRSPLPTHPTPQQLVGAGGPGHHRPDSPAFRFLSLRESRGSFSSKAARVPQTTGSCAPLVEPSRERRRIPVTQGGSTQPQTASPEVPNRIFGGARDGAYILGIRRSRHLGHSPT
ncbi:hypothetical protein NDU88_004519 [Pleurodeles waltl]|uniref:Secreted protein n=1 Tax=Pleurodeles waltl TaxID=8319 RepID=A0AAV7SJ40_PLEWA|nr:hypothetical protein NDU88_004519 [Pleurodeles waltl]